MVNKSNRIIEIIKFKKKKKILSGRRTATINTVIKIIRSKNKK